MNLTPLSIKFDAPMPMNVIPKSKVRIEVVATMQAPRRTSQGSIVPHQRRVRIRIRTYVCRTYVHGTARRRVRRRFWEGGGGVCESRRRARHGSPHLQSTCSRTLVSTCGPQVSRVMHRRTYVRMHAGRRQRGLICWLECALVPSPGVRELGNGARGRPLDHIRCGMRYAVEHPPRSTYVRTYVCTTMDVRITVIRHGFGFVMMCGSVFAAFDLGRCRDHCHADVWMW